MEKIPVAGEIYRHFKGDMYRVVTTAKHADTDGSEEESGLDAGLLAFLEAETYAEKLKVYSSLAGRIDEHMLNTIAVSMDLELSGGSVEEQYDNLKSCLLTLERYECSRLR